MVAVITIETHLPSSFKHFISPLAPMDVEDAPPRPWFAVEAAAGRPRATAFSSNDTTRIGYAEAASGAAAAPARHLQQPPFSRCGPAAGRSVLPPLTLHRRRARAARACGAVIATHSSHAAGPSPRVAQRRTGRSRSRERSAASSSESEQEDLVNEGCMPKKSAAAKRARRARRSEHIKRIHATTECSDEEAEAQMCDDAKVVAAFGAASTAQTARASRPRRAAPAPPAASAAANRPSRPSLEWVFEGRLVPTDQVIDSFFTGACGHERAVDEEIDIEQSSAGGSSAYSQRSARSSSISPRPSAERFSAEGESDYPYTDAQSDASEEYCRRAQPIARRNSIQFDFDPSPRSTGAWGNDVDAEAEAERDFLMMPKRVGRSSSLDWRNRQSSYDFDGQLASTLIPSFDLSLVDVQYGEYDDLRRESSSSGGLGVERARSGSLARRT